LQNERSRRGLTIDQVSTALRIRPAILESLEASDFEHMPLKGHARNMVSSYARYLGLNSVELTEQFLHEYHEYENDQALANSAYRNKSNDRADDFFPSGSGTPSRRTVQSSRNTAAQTRSQGARSMWDKPIPNSQLGGGYDSRSRTAQRMAAGSARRGANGGVGASVGGGRSSGRGGQGSSRGGGYSSGGGGILEFIRSLFGALTSSPIAAIATLIVILILLLVLWAVISNSCSARDEGMVEVTGGAVVNETTSSLSEITLPTTTDTSLLPDTTYGPFTLYLEPEPGSGPWTEVEVDGINVYNGGVTDSMEWEVNSSCKVSTAQPSNLHVYRGENEVELTQDEDNSAMYSASMEVVERPVNDKTTNTPVEGGETGSTGSTGTSAGATGSTGSTQ
jgi:hypothetical protein